MSIVLVVYWRVRIGYEVHVAHFFGPLVHAALKEPGCLNYNITRSRGNKRIFVILQEFTDLEAARDHQLSSHYKYLVEDHILPHLEENRTDVLDGLDIYQPEKVLV
ncbi:putative quinol monooxygenase [Pedobacter caeni]|uniref:Quinol monooxygenase YgiN n=1 Tax=Pedobacter caeni TaxID=288992 RepID=A0A1M5HD43_9SPHI|nr:antibiotic biosynthesis monooxygenase family protein [Pedobacter caeni]SHG13847.1 Quinol monooxygenase YgiN [Pedobacter caeni]